MTTEEILRQQIAELEKLVQLKDKRIVELTRDKHWPTPTQKPYKSDYWDFNKVHCGSEIKITGDNSPAINTV